MFKELQNEGFYTVIKNLFDHNILEIDKHIGIEQNGLSDILSYTLYHKEQDIEISLYFTIAYNDWGSEFDNCFIFVEEDGRTMEFGMDENLDELHNMVFCLYHKLH